jgi:hypothetical protein
VKRKRRKYLPVEPGEWVAPKRRGYRMACCDCGLIHRINFRIVNGQIQFQAFRAGKLKAKA